MFKKTTRNFDNVQFSDLRKKVDGEFNDLHDELSECYYDKKPFRDYGILDKETFDKLHGLVFMKRDVRLNDENEKQEKPDEEIRKNFDKKIPLEIKALERNNIKL